MATILFQKLQTGDFREAREHDNEHTNIESEAQAWGTGRQKGYLPDARQGVLLALRWGDDNEFCVPFCGIRKSGWFKIFLLKMLLDLHRDAVCSPDRGETSFRQRLVGTSLRNSTKQRCFVMPWAVQYFSWGAGLAPNAEKKPSDLHGGTVCEAEGGEPSSRQRLVGILPKVRQKRCHFVVPWGGGYPG